MIVITLCATFCANDTVRIAGTSSRPQGSCRGGPVVTVDRALIGSGVDGVHGVDIRGGDSCGDGHCGGKDVGEVAVVGAGRSGGNGLLERGERSRSISALLPLSDASWSLWLVAIGDSRIRSSLSNQGGPIDISEVRKH